MAYICHKGRGTKFALLSTTPTVAVLLTTTSSSASATPCVRQYIIQLASTVQYLEPSSAGICHCYFGFRFTTVCATKCCSVVFGVTLRLLVINTSSSSPVKNKRGRLPPTSVINLPRSSGSVCIAFGGRTVHNAQQSQILAENRDFCLLHMH